MSKSDRRAMLYVVFLETFRQEGHFLEVIEHIEKDIQNLYAEYTRQMLNDREYSKLIKAVDRIANSLRGNESTLEMIILWAVELSLRYVEICKGTRKELWRILYEKLEATEQYRTLISRVPNEKDLQAADFCNEIFQLFFIAAKECDLV